MRAHVASAREHVRRILSRGKTIFLHFRRFSHFEQKWRFKKVSLIYLLAFKKSSHSPHTWQISALFCNRICPFALKRKYNLPQMGADVLCALLGRPDIPSFSTVHHAQKSTVFFYTRKW